MEAIKWYGEFLICIWRIKKKYSSTMGRTCDDIIGMFKFLLSDRCLLERTQADLLFKYF